MGLESAQDIDRSNRFDPENPQRRMERMIQSARIGGRRVWLELLYDREDWNNAPDWAQDEAIKAVATQLGSSFQLIRTETYECGGQRHRIAQFEHQPTGIALNLIPGGHFTMGSFQCFHAEPHHEVLIKPLLVGAAPVTQAQWDRFGGLDERKWHGATLPIEGVSWDDIETWLSQPKIGGQLALPSEAEWEYFCRAGTKSSYCFGNSESKLKSYAWFRKNSGGSTKPVAKKKPNAFGLYDVHGNVWEWCQDHWHGSYEGAPTDGSAWTTGGNASKRVYRGGCWEHDAGLCRSAIRSGVTSSYRFSFFGFRLCMRLDKLL